MWYCHRMTQIAQKLNKKLASWWPEVAAQVEQIITSQMLEWTTSGPGTRFGLYVHHDDAEREYAYDRKSAIGRLDRGLNEAQTRSWVIVSMKNDWKRIFPFDAVNVGYRTAGGR